jgi:hypothetical protein
MQVFVNISSRGCFYSKELCPSAFTGWLELRWAPFLPHLKLLPGTGSIQILSYTLQRWSLVPIRDQNLAAHPSHELVHTSFVWGPVDDPNQSLSSSATPHTHPFVMAGWLRAYSQSLGHSPLATGFSQSLGPFPLPRACSQSLGPFPACPGLRPFPQILGHLPLPSFRTTIIDHRYTWALRGPTHYCNPAGCSYGMVHPLICERKSVQLTSSSHSRSYGWSLFTVLESLAILVINPRWSFPLQWDLHHTHTMVPLPTILGQQPFWLKPLPHIIYEDRTFCF